MSHLVPERADGSRKPEAEYSPDEKASIARQVLDSQRDNAAYGSRPIDTAALAMAQQYSTDAGDDVTAGECAASITAAALKVKK